MKIEDAKVVLKNMLDYTCNGCAYKNRWTSVECEGCSYYRATVTAIGLLSTLEWSKENE